MNIKQRIAAASDRLSWRLTQQIESAYSRIMGIRERHDGSQKYTDTANNMNWHQFDRYDPVVFDGLKFGTAINIDRFVPAGSPICINKEVTPVEIRFLRNFEERRKFTRSALWFWCLLWGHWEYYEGHA